MINAWRQKFREAMGNPDNYGMAKRFVMAGIAAGYDMTTEAGTAAFVQQFNAGRLASPFRSLNSTEHFHTSAHQSFDSPFEQSQPINKTLKERKKLLKRLKRK